MSDDRTREDLDEQARSLGVPGPEHLPNKETVEHAIDAALAAVNPALEPEPAPPVERAYKVVGPRRVLGHEPGARFRATLPPHQEAHLLQAGHLTIEKEKA